MNATARCWVVLALSGLLHEYGTWAGFGDATGWHLGFVMADGLAVMADNWAPFAVASIGHIPQAKG
jgi:hypothetical protein